MSDQELIDGEYRWSTAKFFIGLAKNITDKALWVWLTYTWIGIKVLHYGKDSVVDIIVISGWIGVTAIYLLGTKGFNRFLSNSKAELEIRK